jgi:hypothetical protein
MNLLVTFRESGVASGPVTVVARADVVATYGCVRSRSEQAGAGHTRRVNSVVQSQASFPVTTGSVSGELTLSPPPPEGSSCPGGQALRLVGIRYSNVTVTDTTTGASNTLRRTFTANQ